MRGIRTKGITRTQPFSVKPPCTETHVDLWFRRDGEPYGVWLARETQALEICKPCPVRNECLTAELRYPASHQHGVRGGMTARARVALIQARDGKEGVA